MGRNTGRSAGCGRQKMNISVVIPHLSLGDSDNTLHNCVSSFPHNLDIEWIIVRDVIGYGKAVNRGMKFASGDYIFVVNNDTQIISGDITKMCQSMHVTVPTLIPAPRDDEPRCFFCVSRNVYEMMKGFYSEDFYDERFYPGYFEDDDLIVRLDYLGIDRAKVSDVVVNHINGGGMTIKQFGEQESFDINKKRFEDKWSSVL